MKIVLQARTDKLKGYVVPLLRGIHHFYIALDHDTDHDAAPTAFDAFIADTNPILTRQQLSYPLCNIATHHLNLSTRGSVTRPPAILSHSSLVILSTIRVLTLSLRAVWPYKTSQDLSVILTIVSRAISLPVLLPPLARLPVPS